MRCTLLPYVPLSPEETETNLEIMSVGNPLLAFYSDKFLGKRKRRIFRQKLFNKEISPSQEFPQSDYNKILKVREIEMAMLQSIGGLIIKRAKYWASRCSAHGGSGIGGWNVIFEDLYQDAVLKATDCIYGYIGRSKKAEFLTYAYRGIDRHLRRTVEKNSMPLLPPAGDGARELVRRYTKLVNEFNDHLTFDAALQLMELTPEQERVLAKAIVRVINESELSKEADVPGDDYTSYATESKTKEGVDILLLESIHRCIQLAKLTEFQKELLTAETTSNRGAKAEVARRYGKTRTRAGQALNEAIEKIQNLFHLHYDE